MGKNPNCLLDKDPHANRNESGDAACKEYKCEYCGWSVKIHAQREKLLAANGLTVCADGLQRLIIPHIDRDPQADG